MGGSNSDVSLVDGLILCHMKWDTCGGALSVCFGLVAWRETRGFQSPFSIFLSSISRSGEERRWAMGSLLLLELMMVKVIKLGYGRGDGDGWRSCCEQLL